MQPLLADLLSDDLLLSGVELLVRIVEVVGILVIFTGALVATVQWLRLLPRRNSALFVSPRLTLGRYLALGLEFQLASDILRTAVAPSFEELGKLAAVAAIRTALNFFLAREISDEQAAIAESRADSARATTPPA